MEDKKEILEKAIQKARDGGWSLWDKVDNYYKCGKCEQEAAFTDFNGKYHDEDGGKWHHKTRKPNLFEYEGDWLLGFTNEKMDFETLRLSIFDIIFNHDFAKALWPGNSRMATWQLDEQTKETVGVLIPAWQYHLQQMVIADDPIKYLGENI